jgi:hypothetical protein
VAERVEGMIVGVRIHTVSLSRCVNMKNDEEHPRMCFDVV